MISDASNPVGADRLLSLAAAPSFALMGAFTGSLGGGPQDVLCLVAAHASPPNGMALIYGLMSAFHLAPWLRPITSRRRA